MSDKTSFKFDEDGLVSYDISLARYHDDDREVRDADSVKRALRLTDGRAPA